MPLVLWCHMTHHLASGFATVVRQAVRQADYNLGLDGFVKKFSTPSVRVLFLMLYLALVTLRLFCKCAFCRVRYFYDSFYGR